MIDALFFSRITFYFFEATAVHRASAPSLWWHMWGAVLAVEREGWGGGLLCANNKPSTYSPLGKPAHPTDRTTGTLKQLFLFWGGGGVLLAPCAFRAAAIEPQQSSRSNQQNNNKNDYLFLYCSMALSSYIITPILTIYYSVFCFVTFGGSAWRLI